MGNHQNNILFVVVLYNMPFEESPVYRSLFNETSARQTKWLIYDNSLLKQYEGENERIVYVHHDQNRGLSYPYNRAAEYARENGYEWLLLLDQDTVFPERMTEIYEDALQKNPHIKLFAPKMRISNGMYMSPAIIRHKLSKLAKNVPTGIQKLDKYSIINSGMLVNTQAFFEVGGYNERVWLDFSDHEFIERFKLKFDEFCILDVDCLQNYSIDEIDANKLMVRYKILCECVKNCPKNKFRDKYDYFYVVFKRGLSLTLKTKKISFLNAFWQNYICK